jgi:tRNA threonylcarbamoyladenosine biosynthesis protein TsaE
MARTVSASPWRNLAGSIQVAEPEPAEPAVTTSGPLETERLAEAIAPIAGPGDVIGLTGELGAGKTRFVRGLARGLGLEPAAISSPTFVLLQEHAPAEPDRPVLVHVDAYRLEGPAGLATIGWEAEGQELREGAVVVIEWAEVVAAGLGPDWLEVTLVHTGEESRRLIFSPHGRWRDKMPHLHTAIRGQRGRKR